MILTGWRIVPADRVATAFDGEGARIYGGRWNSIGVSMVYASERLSLAALEQLVHINPAIPRHYKSFEFRFDEKLRKVFDVKALPRHWQQEPPPPSLQQQGDAWVKSADSVILAVPSAIIPAESNLLINPNHPDFSKIQIAKPTDFPFDHRLL